MKGDRMPSVVSPLANSMGEDYTDSWLDYLLDPSKLDSHLVELYSGRINHPSPLSIIKTLLKQYEKNIVNSTSTTSVLLSTQTASTTPQLSKRSKVLIELIIKVVVGLKYTLEDFEKMIPIKHQRFVLEQLEVPNDKVPLEYQTFLQRWILTGIIKGTPIKYLLSNATSTQPQQTPTTTSKPQQPLSNSSSGISLVDSSGLTTPPSTPPPTPPSFITISSIGPGSVNQSATIEQITALEEMVSKAIEYLTKWIKDNSTSVHDQINSIISLELGEFQFYKESYFDAKQLFNSALQYINKVSSLSTPLTTVTKERIQSFILACKTIDFNNNSNNSMVIDDHQQQQQDLNTPSIVFEKSLCTRNYQETLTILFNDLFHVANDDENLKIEIHWGSRLNLELDKDIPKSYQTKIQLNNIIKAVIIVNSISNHKHKSQMLQKKLHFQKYLNERYFQFKRYSVDEIQDFFKLLQSYLKKYNNNNQGSIETSIKQVIIEIYGVLKNPFSNNTDSFEKYSNDLFPNLLSTIYNNNENSNNSNGYHNNSNVQQTQSAFNQYLTESNLITFKKVIQDELKSKYSLSDTEISNLITQDKLQNIMDMNIEVEQLDQFNSTPELEYLKFYLNICKNNQISENSDKITTDFETLLQSNQTPNPLVIIGISVLLIKQNQWNLLKTLNNQLLQKSNNSIKELLNIIESLSNLSIELKVSDNINNVDNNNSNNSNEMDTSSDNNNSQLIINLFIQFINSIKLPTLNKSQHWIGVGGTGLLQYISNCVLLEVLSSIFVGVIHAIQVHKKQIPSSLELNLEIYPSFAKVVSGYLLNSSQVVSTQTQQLLELDLFITDLYQETINRWMSIEPGNGKLYLYLGDIYFEKKYYRDSLRYYLLSCCHENSFYTDSTKSNDTTHKYLLPLSYRIYHCLIQLRSPMQAIIVSQLFKNQSQSCSVIFKIIQDDYLSLDPNYFQYIWEIPILEILINTYSKLKDQVKLSLLYQITSNFAINEFNNSDIRSQFIKFTLNNYWKQLSNDFLLT
ncbi:hypothetical protein DLAC_06622 [Tieghemostelium lacteum]|uniref:INTS8 TPR repeats domain-containing protein n=1 Tax=Tieghemostelium lacteum TaxID=361077 RepID=A0A151ZF82_TIELA|nr:hypothetical protein DLAC_06622 [Tieghemostelium lacteum]|eukprot:KYQ92626.1 hypothetical protein DLAC_06622 [Tieghemostelium lacteum]